MYDEIIFLLLTYKWKSIQRGNMKIKHRDWLMAIGAICCYLGASLIYTMPERDMIHSFWFLTFIWIGIIFTIPLVVQKVTEL